MSEENEKIDVKSICTNIIGIGRNYKDPSKEFIPTNEDPFIFAKPIRSIITEGSSIQIPKGWGSIIHEVELGVVIGKTAKFVKEDSAMDYVLGYVLALDMGRCLDLTKYPILLHKGFDTACPISDFIPKSKVKDVNNLSLKLTVNGEIRHDGNTRDLIHGIPKLISYLSSYFTLEYGDLILTGTPIGISTVKHGDLIEASLADLAKVKFPVIELQ
ncbi:unnamed protein product [Brachionus calyciflorus]|uniref:oxaloacetate tautomerase n=1 Tax=Brachionus calyciflorus TaxID=104777 RepID=A0A813LXP3_9BILA|nr:unnamed protein product [Brachionus calyciflorus]